MRYLALLFTIAVFSLALVVFAQDQPEAEDKVITNLGVITYNMPKENLTNVGFSEDKLISYVQDGKEEYITFIDISLGGDNITFYLEDGKIKDWFRGNAVGTLDGVMDK